MFTALLAGVVELLIVIGGAVLVYEIFLSDIIARRRGATQKQKTLVSNVAKMAKVKLVSDDPKDIEKFIATNAENLSDEMVKQLVDRIEAIKTDQIISADTIMKSRFESLEKNPHVGSTLDSMFEELGEAEEVAALANSKRNGK
jgi:hypothetical protein